MICTCFVFLNLLQRCIDSVSQASTTLLEGPLWLKTDGKKWKKFHFILRDYNLFQTTKSKKGSVHDVHFVASLATVKVYNGIGWKKRYKAPTDFCFALKPPEVQEKKAHIRYLCAENEFVKWGWYSMVRINEITITINNHYTFIAKIYFWYVWVLRSKIVG